MFVLLVCHPLSNPVNLCQSAARCVYFAPSKGKTHTCTSRHQRWLWTAPLDDAEELLEALCGSEKRVLKMGAKGGFYSCTTCKFFPAVADSKQCELVYSFA